MSIRIRQQCVVLFTTASIFIASPYAMAFSETRYEAAIKLLQDKSDSAAEQAASEFKDMLKAEPENPLLLAYAGASVSKLATTTIFPWKKMSYAEDGLAMLDKSLQIIHATPSSAMHGSVPVELEVKLAAANTFLSVPGFMNRAARGQKLLNDILEHKAFPATALPFRGAVWLCAAHLALTQNRHEDAKRYLNQILQNHAPQSDAANRLLQGLPS